MLIAISDRRALDECSESVLPDSATLPQRIQNKALTVMLAIPLLINTVQAVLIDRDSSLGSLRDVKAPALVVPGKNDTILPAPHSRRIAERLPNAKHVEVDEAAHLVPLEVPVTANKLILEFLRSLPAQKASHAPQSS